MTFISFQDLETFYDLFVNALSFTIAINAVDSTADVTDLLLLAGTAFGALLFGLISQNMIIPLLRYVDRSQTDDNLASFVLGPLRAIKFLIEKFNRVVTHFLSTTLGRWLYVTLGNDNLPRVDIILITLVTLTLSWLISVSAGFVEPINKVFPPSNTDLNLAIQKLASRVKKNELFLLQQQMKFSQSSAGKGKQD